MISLVLGVVIVTALQPGAGLGLPLPPEGAHSGIEAGAMTLKDFVTHVFPRSIIEAMANNEILQIVVFSVFVGVALASLGERTAGIVVLAEQLVEVMLKITGYVMLVAPFAVFAAIAATITQNGLGILLTYSKFIVSFYFALLVLWFVIAAFGGLVIGRRVGAVDGVDARSDSRRVLDREFRGRLPAHPRTAREVRRAAAHIAASCCRSAIRSTSTAR